MSVRCYAAGRDLKLTWVALSPHAEKQERKISKKKKTPFTALICILQYELQQCKVG